VGKESGGSFEKKMTELPKDEPEVDSVFLSAGSQQPSLSRIPRQERGESDE